MIYPPSNWKSIYTGGYYIGKSSLIRDMDSRSHPLQKANLSFIYDTLNQLGKIKWRINKKMLSVVEYLWANGGGVAKIPPKHLLDVQKLLNEASPTNNNKKIFAAIKSNNEIFSLQCSFLNKLRIAQSYKDVSSIFFPQNIDFRGRVYPMPPHLNHMGDDISRGLLEYSLQKPLGKSGLRWLKISVANHMGKDKLSFNDREKYTDSIWPTIQRIGKNPYQNLDWLEADSPFQALAAMLELYDAIVSGCPETFESRAHCHVDGSFNGMQHYVAMSKDKDGAKSVNLICSEKPQDVYTSILGLVKEELKNEKNAECKQLAELLLPIINRKTIKQTVMTSIYGVTLIGAREQIHKQLKDNASLPEDKAFKASLYLAKITIKCIGIRFRVYLNK
jgi:DNA-directed RNA polymerase